MAQPPCDRDPEAYKPRQVVSLAKWENTKGARLNAESWTQSAMAMYVQRTFNLEKPPVPKDFASSDLQNDPSIMAMGNRTIGGASVDLVPMPD